MERRRVRATAKDEDGDITALCNSYAAWSPRKKAGAILDIEGKTIAYYVEVGKEEVGIHVVDDLVKGKYLRTDPDKTEKNNLDDLPDC